MKAGGDTSISRIHVTPEDVEYFGLSTPTGSRTDPAVVVTDEDIDRLGLKAPAADREDPHVEVTSGDIDKYGDFFLYR